MNTSSTTLIYTCCTCNFAGAANALGQSIARSNPDARFVIVFIDHPDGVNLDTLTSFEYLSLPAQGNETFETMTHRYNAFELSCAVKLLSGHILMDQHPEAGHFIYLDSDIHVYADLAPVIDELNRSVMVLSPHATEPLPRDGCYPTDMTYLRYGQFNAGFFGFRRCEEIKAVFAWLEPMLETHARDNPIKGLYVDQKWLDLLPQYFDGIGIIKHKGVNVGHWNLHHCSLHETPQGWFVDRETPLVFFHFSGYSPDKPEVFSRLQNRHTFEGNPALKKLCDAYADGIRQAHNPEAASLPYGYAKRARQAKNAVPLYKRIIKVLIWRAIFKLKVDL